MNRVLSVLFTSGLVCLIAVGCGPGGPQLGTVTGRVTLDGQPVTNGLVTFTPVEGGRAASGKTDASGQYELVGVGGRGAVVGQHRVTVTTLPEAAAVAEMSSDSAEYEKQAMGDTSAYDSARVEELIPARYNTTSELTEEVKAGSNVIDLVLTSNGS